MNTEIEKIIELTAERAANKAIGPVYEKINKVDKAVARIEEQISFFPDVYEPRVKHDARCAKRRSKLVSLLLGIPAVTGAVLGILNLVGIL